MGWIPTAWTPGEEGGVLSPGSAALLSAASGVVATVVPVIDIHRHSGRQAAGVDDATRQRDGAEEHEDDLRDAHGTSVSESHAREAVPRRQWGGTHLERNSGGSRSRTSRSSRPATYRACTSILRTRNFPPWMKSPTNPSRRRSPRVSRSEEHTSELQS